MAGIFKELKGIVVRSIKNLTAPQTEGFFDVYKSKSVRKKLRIKRAKDMIKVRKRRKR